VVVEMGGTPDTRVEAPAPQPTGTPTPADPQPSSSEPAAKKEADTTSVGDIFRQVKKEMVGGKSDEGATGEDGKTDTVTDDTTGKPNSDPAGERPPAPPSEFKYKDMAEAVKANQEAAKKITEQAELIKKLQAGSGKAPGNPDADPNGGDPDGGSDDDTTLPDLSEDELDALWEQDPAAARRYERKLSESRFSKAMEPFQKIMDQMESDARFSQEMAAIKELSSDFDKDHGQGAFEKIQEQISDDAFLNKLLTTAKLGPTIQSLIRTGDKLGVIRIITREAKNYNDSIAAQKRQRSSPSDTGSGPTTEAGEKIESVKDAYRAAKKQLTR
jgi:hypothetical protein